MTSTTLNEMEVPAKVLLSETVRNDSDAITELALLSPMAYDRVRKERAAQLNVQVTTLDAEVKRARAVSGTRDEPSLPFTEVVSYRESIDPAQLLDEIVEVIHRFIVIDIEYAITVALWITFTWFIEHVQIAPIAIINAPEKSCGKSQMLDLMSRMSRRPLSASNSSTAGLFRACELWTPTMFVDEADTFIRENDELKGLINAGHTRANAFVLRVVGDAHEPKMFCVWGAKAFAGIALEKHLPDATMSRAVVIQLRRKLAHESVSRLRHADSSLFSTIASKLSRFADDYAHQVRLARPVLPDALSDREQDNWEPLLAIAGCAGDAWLKRATEAALKLSTSGEKSESTGNELLADIQSVFKGKHLDKISTANLIQALAADDERPWATYNRGISITPRQLAKLLSAYGISSKTVRMGEKNTPKGFDLSQFKDAFARYLADPENAPQQSNIPQEAMQDKALDVAEDLQRDIDALLPATPKPMPHLAAGFVAADDAF